AGPCPTSVPASGSACQDITVTCKYVDGGLAPSSSPCGTDEATCDPVGRWSVNPNAYCPCMLAGGTCSLQCSGGTWLEGFDCQASELGCCRNAPAGGVADAGAD